MNNISVIKINLKYLLKFHTIVLRYKKDLQCSAVLYDTFLCGERRVKWLINRLLTMGPAEIVSRVTDLGRHGLLRVSLQRIQRRAERSPGRTPAAVELPDLDALVRRIGPEQRTPIMTLADQWMTHRASFLGFEAVPLGRCIDWHRDIGTGVVGPLTCSGGINYRDAAVAGDVMNIWELNRLH